MNSQHLTEEQIDQILSQGETPSEVLAHHLNVCTLCAAEVASLRSSFGLLHEAVTSMAREERFRRFSSTSLLAVPSRREARPILRAPAYFALAASVAIAAALIPLSRAPKVPAVPAHPVIVTAPAESDEALLNEIDQQLSASVPTALEPLADLATDKTSTKPSTNKKD